MKARPIATDRARVHRHQWGMTLLELLVVIALMSVVGFMALSQVGDDLSQARYQDTENRLIALHRAIVGYEEPVFNGQRLFSGYAADNGLLPTTTDGLSALINKPTGFDNYDVIWPRFDPTPDGDGYNGGSDDDLDATGAALVKGWRGPYLIARSEVDTLGAKIMVYRDGWGNQDPDSGQDKLNFGWWTNLMNATDDLDITIVSLGRDGLHDLLDTSAETDYDADTHLEIVPNDWMAHSELSITIHNGTGKDIVLEYPKCLRVSLLAYRNQGGASTDRRWLRLTSECVFGGSSTYNIGSCIDGDDNGDVSTPTSPPGDFDCLGSASNSQTVTLTKDEYFDPLNPSVKKDLANRIPQGQHVLLLIVDQESDKKHDNTNGDDDYCTTECKSTTRTVKKVDFFSRAALPNVTLEIAP